MCVHVCVHAGNYNKPFEYLIMKNDAFNVII